MSAISWQVKTRAARWAALFGLGAWLAAESRGAERINHEGRILGPAPVVTAPILFNTAEADAALSAMQMFPIDNAWNEDVSRRPRLANSDAMIAQIMADLASSRQTLRSFFEMNFVLVPDDQPLVPVSFVDYPDESDPSPYPIPDNLPIETWPVGTGALTLAQWQQDVNDTGGDRHAIIVQPGKGFVWETWQMKKVGGAWQASNGAKFNLNSDQLRPFGWTSGDAAGLSMFPALVRYDECQRGMVEHAMRLVVKRTRVGPIYPATHQASVGNSTNTNIPAMGQRLRLKASFNIPTNWTQQEQAVLRGLKKHGAIVADNGGFFSISVAPDNRYPAGAFDHLSTISITNFEVIQTTGATEGPRAPNPPSVKAGPNQALNALGAITLGGYVAYQGVAPAIQWRVYAGPGPVNFGDSTQTNTTATFSAPGTYTLILSADDGVHAVAYDAMTAQVNLGLTASIAAAGAGAGGGFVIQWTGGTPPFAVEESASLPTTSWQSIMTTSVNTVTVPSLGAAGYFRVRSN